MTLPSLFDATDDELLALTGAAYRVRQIRRWLFSGADSFDQMTDVSQELRRSLAERWCLRTSRVAQALAADDGTVKLQIELADGARIEAVLLRDAENRRTACLSTQVGCPVSCVFCKTGTRGFSRNLTSFEVAEQFFHLRKTVTDSLNPELLPIANIVVMGMGEPLLNLDALQKGLSYTGLADRRVTISTSGIIRGIEALTAGDSGCRLAVSVTSARPELRRRLMPVTAANPLPALKDALTAYQKRHKKRITLEAVLLGGLNTGPDDARALARFADGLEVLVNLIPWNPVDGLSLDGIPLRSPRTSECQQYQRLLEELGLKTELRREKGRSTMAACGQLGGFPA